MANHNDVTAHHDVSASVGPAGGDTNASHTHPYSSVPVRIAKESSFAASGLDVPAEQRRPARDSGSEHDHPANQPIRTDDQSLIGERLGEHPHAPVQPTEIYRSPEYGQMVGTFEKNADIAAANANFQDCSEMLMRTRKGTTTND
jgi:hypothetical protein